MAQEANQNTFNCETCIACNTICETRVQDDACKEFHKRRKEQIQSIIKEHLYTSEVIGGNYQKLVEDLRKLADDVS